MIMWGFKEIIQDVKERYSFQEVIRAFAINQEGLKLQV